jgi:hypothetical protein
MDSFSASPPPSCLNCSASALDVTTDAPSGQAMRASAVPLDRALLVSEESGDAERMARRVVSDLCQLISGQLDASLTRRWSSGNPACP